MRSGEIAFSTDSFNEIALFIRGEQGLYKHERVSRDFWGECTSLAGPEVLGMLHLHAKEFQVLAGQVL